ncbi:SGNH/GDSL hydrolase family protein [uncultured bacterium]|nr:SGNH/GDSL hydrolase family protein [uncultured bacterium]
MYLAIGDEQTPGYNPKTTNRTESKALTKALGQKVISKGVKGSSLTLKNKGNIMHQLDQFSLPAYDGILLFFGANDYFHSKANLGKINEAITKAVATIRRKSQYTRIYGTLPLPMYDKNGNAYMGKRNQAFYTLHDLMDMIRITYTNNNVYSLNWLTLTAPIVNRNNAKQRLINGWIPTKETQQLMAQRISTFIKQHPVNV